MEIGFSSLANTVLMFALALIGTLISTRRLLRLFATAQLPKKISPVVLLLFVIFCVISLLYGLIYKNFLPTLFTIAMSLGIFWLNSVFLKPLLAFVLTVSMITVKLLVGTVLSENLFLVLAIIGFAAAIGLVIPWKILLAVSILAALFDYFLVTVTETTPALINFLAAREVVPAIASPQNQQELLAPQKQIISSNSAFFVGIGDFLLPAIIAAAALKQSLKKALAVSLGNSVISFPACLSFYFFVFAAHLRPPLPSSNRRWNPVRIDNSVLL